MTRYIIGVDVGNGFTKTVNTEFVSSLRDFGETKPAILDKTIKVSDIYYTVGGERTRTKTDNKEDDTDFVLALAGIGEELKARGIKESPVHVILSEGLPIERCIENNQEFDQKYYKIGETIEFEYEGAKRVIIMDDVIVNPQGVAGIAELIVNKKVPKRCLVVDLGSWTVDVFLVDDWKAQGATAQSFNEGVINLFNSCNDEIRRRTGMEVLESQIQDVLRGEEMVLSPKYCNIIEEQARKYTKHLADIFRERKYNPEALPFVFMGGGARIMERYGKDSFPMATYITNVRANAIGYEKMAHIKCGKNGLS